MIQSAQITRLDPDGKPPYQSQNGPLYGFRVEFDNGQGGLVNSKSQTPPYGVGQTVYYEVTGQVGKLNKLKISKNPPMGQPQFAEPAQSAPNTAPRMAPMPVPQVHIPSTVEPLKPVFGATVGMAINQALDLLTRDLNHDERVERIVAPVFWHSVHEVASDIIRVSRHLEAGHLAPSPSERSNRATGHGNLLPARPVAQSHPDLEPAEDSSVPF